MSMIIMAKLCQNVMVYAWPFAITTTGDLYNACKMIDRTNTKVCLRTVECIIILAEKLSTFTSKFKIQHNYNNLDCMERMRKFSFLSPYWNNLKSHSKTLKINGVCKLRYAIVLITIEIRIHVYFVFQASNCNGHAYYSSD